MKLLRTAAGLSFVALMMRVWMVLGSNVDPRGGWPPKVLPLHMDRLLIGGASIAPAGRGGGAGAASFEVGLRRDRRALAVAFALNPAGGWRWMPPVGFTLTAVASPDGLGGR